MSPFFYMKTLDQIEITLRSRIGNTHSVYIDVVDNSLSQKWLTHLNTALKDGLHLEKNYHWIGFTERDLEYICSEINSCIEQINQFDWQSKGATPYTINDTFTPDALVTPGEVGDGKPGYRLNHDKTNWLHRYFEDLQGHSGNISTYYNVASPGVKNCIRKLNLLCHELESFVESERKRQYAPEWVQCNQLFCFLHSPRFQLYSEKDYDLFGLETLHRDQGQVYIGVNKAVTKTHWEVFIDEGDAEIDDLVTTALRPQIEAAADFDISWSRSSRGQPWRQQRIDEFRDWLIKHGWNPEDPALTIGHPLVAQVDIQKSFGTTDSQVVQDILSRHLDVYSIKTSAEYCEYPYRWSDSDYNTQQIQLL